MKNSLLAILCSVAIGCMSPALFADTGAQNVKVVKTTTVISKHCNAKRPFATGRAKLNKMSPHERQAFLAQARIKWERLSFREKHAFKKEVRKRFASYKKEREKQGCVKIKKMHKNYAKKIERLYALKLLEQRK
ncbi:MAG: hypothetical protein ACHQJ6_00330 [Candidatus Berkiellales bacterium]